ncbi:SAM-dependent methyltransferase [Mycobacteriaceae bacterium 1482268.1]|nr:SAM-dependent methyltransferase [Mycobacteriaceae bacterium 1482268.1]
MDDTKAHWEEHYGARDRIWSGRVNVQFAEVVGDLTPGRALDLGCGEGGDAVWLAERGWSVVAVDISDIALDRAREAAAARGVTGSIEFLQVDLSADFPDGTFDLVSSQFLHSRVYLDRQKVLERGLAALRPGGLLVIVDHGSAPPWPSKLDHHHEFPSADEVVAGLNPKWDEFERVRVDSVERQAAGPDGEQWPWMDNVIVLRRREQS